MSGHIVPRRSKLFCFRFLLFASIRFLSSETDGRRPVRTLRPLSWRRWMGSLRCLTIRCSRDHVEFCSEWICQVQGGYGWIWWIRFETIVEIEGCPENETKKDCSTMADFSTLVAPLRPQVVGSSPPFMLETQSSTRCY